MENIDKFTFQKNTWVNNYKSEMNTKKYNFTQEFLW